MGLFLLEKKTLVWTPMEQACILDIDISCIFFSFLFTKLRISLLLNRFLHFFFCYIGFFWPNWGFLFLLLNALSFSFQLILLISWEKSPPIFQYHKIGKKEKKPWSLDDLSCQMGLMQVLTNESILPRMSLQESIWFSLCQWMNETTSDGLVLDE